MDEKTFTVKIGGQAGQGIKSAGLLLAKLATRSGYNIYDHIEYPSIIRGGHNVIKVCISKGEVGGPLRKTDFIVALNQDTINKHLHELSAGSGILYDEDDKLDVSKVEHGIEIFKVPLSRLATESGGKELLSNTVAIGAVAALFSADLNVLKEQLTKEFSGKGTEVVEMNHKAAESGYNFVLGNYKEKIKNTLSLCEKCDLKMIVTGDEAIALGAIAGGLQFAAIYPMSPITNILHALAAHQEKYGYIYKQPEDEISAINMAIGASFAGARSMVATSGGGFCLMTEGYGLAGMTETPLVIVEGMRSGPATGLPTWSSQGDLRFVLHAHQDEFPRIVLAPADAREAFYLTMEAFNLADKYQTPVLVLIDKNICESDQSFPIFDVSSYSQNRGKITKELVEGYKRYVLEDDGVSLRALPGSGNHILANSDEHDPAGYSSEEIGDRNSMMEKRMKKLKTCEKEDMKPPILFGPQQAEITLVSWGSNKGNILKALEGFQNVNYLHTTWMNPLPLDEIRKVLSASKHIIGVESNYSGQFSGIIQEKTGIEIKDRILKYDGRPIYPEEIADKINSVLGRGQWLV